MSILFAMDLLAYVFQLLPAGLIFRTIFFKVIKFSLLLRHCNLTYAIYTQSRNLNGLHTSFKYPIFTRHSHLWVKVFKYVTIFFYLKKYEIPTLF